MRLAAHRLVILLTLWLPLASQAGPETGSIGNGVDLDMLDMNGSPFRTFHLGHYAKGLDDQHPAATALPSEELQHQGSPSVQEDPTPYTGLTAGPVDQLPGKPDITPLLNGYDDNLLLPGAVTN